ncbi:MAG: hypothetical protein HQL02_03875, partial [Nitrospirae bacterium]|nr:hypothetical protein [Nitrospirota bacterium]
MNPLRLDIQGGQQYLPLAKKKLRELKASMKRRRILNDHRFFTLEDATIFVQSSSYSNAGSTTTAGSHTGSAAGGGIFIGSGGGINIDTYGFLPIGAGGSVSIGDISPIGSGSGGATPATYKTSGAMDLIRIRGLKKATSLILIHIATTNDPLAALTQDDYRVLTYRIVIEQGSVIKLTPVDLKLKQLTIEDAGQSLVIQSSPRDVLATLPSIFTYNPLIDNTDGMDRTWGAQDNLFGQNRVIGSLRAMMPQSKTLGYSYNARCNYILNPQNNSGSLLTVAGSGSLLTVAGSGSLLTVAGSVLSMDFCLKFTHMGFGLFYVGLMPYNGGNGRGKARWEIQYKDTPDGQWQTGSLIGEDHEDPDPFADGYTWMFYLPVAVLSPTLALFRTVRKEQVYSIFGVRQVAIKVKIDVLHRCSSETRQGNFAWPCEFGLTYYYETLKMGNITIEELEYQESTQKYQSIDIEPWMVGITSERAWCGDWPNYLVDFVAVVTTSSFPGITLPRLTMSYDGKTIHGAHADGHFKNENNGDKDLHVIMYDNINADDTFIVFYTYTEIYFISGYLLFYANLQMG